MITWNPDDKHSSMSLSNNDLTVSFPLNSWGAIRTTQGKSNGRWYWEIVVNNLTDAYAVGIGTKDSPLSPPAYSIGAGFRLYRPHQHLNYGLIINQEYGIEPEWGTVYIGNGEIVGLACNIDEGYIDYYKNGGYLGRAFDDINTLSEVFPMVTMYSSISSVAQLTANFGTTKFDIATSNPEEWRRLEDEGYLPYDTPLPSLIKSNNKYYTFQNNEWVEVELTEENFNYTSFDTLTSYIDNISLPMEYVEDLGEGKLYRKNISKRRNIQEVEVI